jgi:ribonuclease P protein component
VPKHSKLLQPLLGKHSFSELIRSKPLAHTEAYAIHLSIFSKEKLIRNDQQTNLPIFLGIIAPKKSYPLAVDRNRVRRVLRAQSVLQLSNLEQLLKAPLADVNRQHQIHCLFRIKQLSKQSSALKKGLMLSHQAYLNPHSIEFSDCVQGLLKQAAQQLVLRHMRAHSNKLMQP